MIIDTASDITIVNPRLFSYNLKTLPSVDNLYSIFTANGSQLNYVAVKKVTISITNITVIIDAIFANIDLDCILGLDFISTSGLLSEFQTVINRKFNLYDKHKIVSIHHTSLRNNIQLIIPEHLSKLYETAIKLLNDRQIDLTKKFISKYQNCFAKNNKDLGKYSEIKHKINTGHSRPIKLGARRIPNSLSLSRQSF